MKTINKLFILLAVTGILVVFLVPSATLTAEAAMSDEEFVRLVLELEPDAGNIERALDAGANVNARLEGLPALYYAITRAISTKNTSLVKLLAEHKADVNINVYDSPLLATVLSELDEDKAPAEVMEKIIRILVKGGADVNAVDKNGNTPLAILAESDTPYAFQLAKILREAGATVKGKKTATTDTPEETTPPKTESDTRQKTQRKVDDAWKDVLSGKNVKNGENKKNTSALKIENVSKIEKKPVKSNLDAYKMNFTLQEIRDPPMNNELAVTIAIPEGWKLKDQQNIVQWNPITYGDPARVAFTLNGPEDEVEFAALSKLNFHYDYGILRVSEQVYQQKLQMYQQMVQMSRRFGTPVQIPVPNRQEFEYKEHVVDSGKIVQKPVKCEDFVKWLMEQDKMVTDIRIKKISKPKQILDELDKTIPELNRQITMMLRQSGANLPFKGITADTAFVELSYTRERKRYEGGMCVVITYMNMGSPCNVVSKANDDYVCWTVSPVLAVSALEGKLENHQMEFAAIMGNTKVNPVWIAKVDYLVAETTRKINEANLKHQQEIQQSMLATQQEIFQKRQDVFNKRADTNSKVMQGWADTMTGTDRVKGPDGKIFAVPTGLDNLPSGYKKVPWAWE